MIDFEAELAAYEEKLIALENLISVSEKMSARDKTFADDLVRTFSESHALSAKQWYWVGVLTDRVKGVEPLYGNLKALWVAFMIAGENLKVPKIRLITNDDIFVQLNFYKAGTTDGYRDIEKDTIKVFVGGWSGHGRRLYAGHIDGDAIHPWNDRMTESVRNVIQDLSLDPLGVAKAMASKLGACMYCGSRLSDDESKKRGYGPTCASHYDMPWGKKRLHREAELKAQIAASKANHLRVVGN